MSTDMSHTIQGPSEAASLALLKGESIHLLAPVKVIKLELSCILPLIYNIILIPNKIIFPKMSNIPPPRSNSSLTLKFLDLPKGLVSSSFHHFPSSYQVWLKRI